MLELEGKKAVRLNVLLKTINIRNEKNVGKKNAVI